MKKTKIVKTGMADIGPKPVSHRRAKAAAVVNMAPATMRLLLEKGSPKGDVLETAKIAGILAAKAVPQLIPMCHPLNLNNVNIRFEINEKKSMITTTAEVSCEGRTGVEMEAMTAASIAALTIYDMMKWADQRMTVTDVKLLEKTGGTGGPFKR